ncbi:MAG: EF-P beta-lysylation protein EpmB [Planctomycetes bacterium]|nr:EF-P beta-lysylation protein EpmB [Planctomycetota bacterium]
MSGNQSDGPGVVGDPGDSAPTWRRQLAGAIRDPGELVRLLGLPEDLLPGARAAAKLFPLLVPRGFAALMRRGDPGDPLLRQVLPLDREADEPPGYIADPLRESSCSPVPGLLRKYAGRALLVVTGACAIHCRYCFRRHFPYGDIPGGRSRWEAALAHVAADPSINELILSGGDPLTLPDGQLAELAEAFAAIPHLRRLRIHSRLPVVLPARVDDALISWFARGRLAPVLVIHANHANELGDEAAAACARLRSAGVTLLNQSVLLAGVNDDAEVLAQLSERLFALGVLPYYLHALDRVRGAAHFAVADARALAIAGALAQHLPGYLVPRLVREEPGATGKTPLGWMPSVAESA